MGRKHSFTDNELLDATRKLIIEHGYEGFRLKSLSEHLPGARSTIYQYYANKEEIVAACMKRVIADVLHKASTIDESDAMDALQQLMQIYAEEANLHQILGDAYKIKPSNDKTAQDLAYVEEAHSKLKIQLMRLFEQAQREKKLRDDIPLPMLIGTFFNLISTPNMMNMPAQQWGKLLFELWSGGSRSGS